MSMRSRLASIVGLAIGLVCGSAALSSGNATTYTNLYSFCPGGGSCTDGRGSDSQLLKKGHILYGVTGGGAHGHGAVFQYDTSTSTYTVLYSFCPSTWALTGTCKNGDTPGTRLIIDTSGNLYGTTQLGGNMHNAGMVFELVKPVTGSTWTFATVYDFCPTLIGSGLCSDGNDPLTGLTYAGQASGNDYDGTSLLFGATLAGGGPAGSLQGDGVVYALQLSGGAWSEKAIHFFCALCSTTCTNCADGIFPYGQIWMDANNDLWGTTLIGGSDSSGAAWELAAGSANLWTATWTETVLYNFCWNGASKCADGAAPTGVMLDATGNIFGTTQQGGNGVDTHGDGILFELTAGSSCTEGGVATFLCESVKHNFCHTTCTDGSFPNGDLVMDSSGNIFGTTASGGTSASSGSGVVFEQAGSTNTTLYTFCTGGGACSDGSQPEAGVFLGGAGNLYGTTDFGGNSNGAGVIFKLVP